MFPMAHCHSNISTAGIFEKLSQARFLVNPKDATCTLEERYTSAALPNPMKTRKSNTNELNKRSWPC